MANLTITVDPETLKRARIKAIEQGTSVNKVLGAYLTAFAGDDRNGHPAQPVPGLEAAHNQTPRESMETGEDVEDARRERLQAFEELFALADQQRSGSGPEGRSWKREDLYDRPILLRDR